MVSRPQTAEETSGQGRPYGDFLGFPMGESLRRLCILVRGGHFSAMRGVFMGVFIFDGGIQRNSIPIILGGRYSFFFFFLCESSSELPLVSMSLSRSVLMSRYQSSFLGVSPGVICRSLLKNLSCFCSSRVRPLCALLPLMQKIRKVSSMASRHRSCPSYGINPSCNSGGPCNSSRGLPRDKVV